MEPCLLLQSPCAVTMQQCGPAVMTKLVQLFDWQYCCSCIADTGTMMSLLCCGWQYTSKSSAAHESKAHLFWHRGVSAECCAAYVVRGCRTTQGSDSYWQLAQNYTTELSDELPPPRTWTGDCDAFCSAGNGGKVSSTLLQHHGSCWERFRSCNYHQGLHLCCIYAAELTAVKRTSVYCHTAAKKGLNYFREIQHPLPGH